MELSNFGVANRISQIGKSRPPQKTINLEYKFCSEIRSGEDFGLGPNCRRFWRSKLASKPTSKLASKFRAGAPVKF